MEKRGEKSAMSDLKINYINSFIVFVLEGRGDFCDKKDKIERRLV
jgi:hypothetical protein